jgi:acyl-coenzyme A thioesterase PaaI-like protein
VADQQEHPDDVAVAGVEELRRLTAAGRTVQNSIVGVLPPAETAERATALLTEVAALLEPYRLDLDGPASWDDLDRFNPTRLLSPVTRRDQLDSQTFVGRVTFGPLYGGANGAVHGGAIPLVFDEALAQLANLDGQTRTASLTVDYRSVTPLGRELTIRGWIERVEGRKVFLRATLHHGDTLTAEAHALFVRLRPGAR